jgi:NAD(P)-dependent dehydrogenase (short-subunit alcohol dehydrogenase family)
MATSLSTFGWDLKNVCGALTASPPLSYDVAMLEGRVAIVTGGGRGIGRAHAERLAAYGARVVVNDTGGAADGRPTTETPADETVAAIRAAGGDAVAHRGDIAEMAVGQAVADLAIERWGRLDIVINNAGIGRPKMVFNLEEDEWDDVIRVHLKGTFAVSRAACRWWRAQAKQHGSTYGRLVNTTTGLLIYSGAGQSNYVAAKGGVAAFTDAVATEMAPYGVTVNAIMPSAMTRLAAVGWRIQRQQRDELSFDATDPVHVAEFACYLASPAAGWISGQTFQIRGAVIEHVGGWHIARTYDGGERPFTARQLAGELPRLFGAGAKRSDPPPKEWQASYRAKKK